ncbi:MAG: hypothetical protein KDA61_17680, partial [Planctomycetales bacterium]|nr:hypothetical protein [Planctomycetales bacterium]
VAHDDSGEGLPGQDSFLDIVANMVGILVILVMVVGVRASYNASHATDAARGGVVATPLADADAPSVSNASAQQLAAELDDAVRRLQDEQRQLAEAMTQTRKLREQATLVEAERLQLAQYRAEIESDINQRRAKLDGESQAAFDTQNQIDRLQIELDDLSKQQLAALDQATDVEEIENVPTPIAHTITGAEVHLRLRGRRLAVVPVDELVEEAVGAGDYLRSQLSSSGEASDLFGPIDGFRVRVRLQVVSEGLPGAPARRSLVEMAEFLPIRTDLGQGVDQALLPNSTFMQTLRSKRSGRPAVVLWVYPDSYSDIGPIKRALWEMSVPLAVRPLNIEDEITFSNRGSKSHAQ